MKGLLSGKEVLKEINNKIKDLKLLVFLVFLDLFLFYLLGSFVGFYDP